MELKASADFDMDLEELKASADFDMDLASADFDRDLAPADVDGEASFSMEEITSMMSAGASAGIELEWPLVIGEVAVAE